MGPIRRRGPYKSSRRPHTAKARASTAATGCATGRRAGSTAGSWDGLAEDELAFYRRCYLRGPEDTRDPRYDLLAADLAGVPPAFIAACALDPLQDDSRALAALLEENGAPVELRIYDGVLHGSCISAAWSISR